MKKEDYSIYRKIFVYLLIYITLSATIIYFDLNRFYLIFNVGLSLIPFIVSSFCLVNKDNAIICILGILITIIFYPNAVYMFTDLIHIKTSEYYIPSSSSADYIMDYVNWIKLSIDFLMIFMSMALSYESLVNILKVIRCYSYKFASAIIIIIVSIITGIAIYIGRFLRFNSWDFLALVDILRNMIANITLNDYMLIGIFSIVHLLVIVILLNLKD